MLVTVNTEEGTVNVTSFPRDLYVFIPTWTNQRINTAFAHGGFQLLQDTMLHNFGFKPDYFVLVNLYAFEGYMSMSHKPFVMINGATGYRIVFIPEDSIFMPRRPFGTLVPGAQPMILIEIIDSNSSWVQ